ncbi:putative gamma-glutamylcyclotransferase CG2811 [Anopheles aquasalis]|uniref:putative gamma-glutamylcyclotransferase CG2811 n=1 Tax=Anopheles aquasalis TaxID=42839 RepID=UPI00215A71E1|nr:putative gamma-glutamylcyclotransferase CG2811 [Anopheles aquasalis]
MSTSPLRRVFVYGTLKRGEPNHHWLTDVANGMASFVGRGTTVARYPLVIGSRYNIPFLLDVPDRGHRVRGEIYDIDDHMLGRLDVLEDYPRLYERRTEAIQCEGTAGGTGEVVSCWIYLLQRFPPHLLEERMLEEYRDSTALPYTESHDDNVFDDHHPATSPAGTGEENPRR